jgi:hypothetical protein
MLYRNRYNAMRGWAIRLIVAVLAIGWCIEENNAAELQHRVAPEVVDVPDFQETESLSVANYETAETDLPHPAVHLDTDFFRAMLDFQNRQGDKELIVLENNAAWSGFPTVVLGGQARLSLLAAATNTEDKFSYLGRFPPDFEGNSATDARILQANAGIAAHVNNWINVYGEVLFSDVFTFPTFKQGSLQMRQAYAVLGDLAQSPWYAFLGKKNVSFGDMGTLSPFSQSVVWHYFGALHEGIGVGYAQDGINVSLTGINGGRGIRAADSEARGQVNNFAVNATLHGGDDTVGWHIGGGYLLGTIYDVMEAEHIDPDAFGPYNSAWDINAQVHLGGLVLAGEFVSTVDDWPVTDHPVIAYRAEAAYDSCFLNRPARYSVSWSEGIQGPSRSEFEFNQQLVVGAGVDLGPYASLSLEYVRSMGFAPLINITTVSDRSVAQDSIVMGMTVVF